MPYDLYQPFGKEIFKRILSESILIFAMPYNLYQPFRKRDILTDIIGKYFDIRYAV
jgi:hypothetical protein